MSKTATKTVAKPYLENGDVIETLQTLSSNASEMTLQEIFDITERLNQIIEKKVK